MRIYAGIGSRRTPLDTCELMTDCAYALALRGWTLRSGGAPGADTAFETGAQRRSPPRLELYLAWPGSRAARLHAPLPGAYEIAERYHPFWPRMGAAARRLCARNAHVILGAELAAPVDMVICWTVDGSPDGAASAGGTQHALRIARGEAPEAEIVNLARPEQRERIVRLISDPERSEL